MKDALFDLTRHLAKDTLVLGKKETVLELPSRLMALAEDVIHRFEKKEPIKEPVACRAGCAYCCHYQVVMTPPEIFLVGTYVKDRYPAAERRRLLERIDRYVALRDGKSLAETASVIYDTPCLFLAAASCEIYEVRPLVCRAWHAIDSNACRTNLKSANSRPEVEGYRHRHYVYKTVAAGLEAAISDMGCQSGTYAIARAMKEYFCHQEPEKAWMRGESVFSGNLKDCL